jgi:gamma-glutamylcyclotransferase (GGCT)/AIG2-like uncharacterized protein YtfP
VKSHLSLFVYGSLKAGECNDFVIKPWVRSCRSASTMGEMRLRPDKYPALYLLDYGPLGTEAYEDDLQLREAPLSLLGHLIHGQLLELEDGVAALRRLDEFEGFFPGRDSQYLRVAISVQTADGPKPCWTYTGVGQPNEAWEPISQWPPPGLAIEPEPYEHGL